MKRTGNDWLAELRPRLQRHGVEVQTDADWVQRQVLEAATLPSLDHPILLGFADAEPTVSAVLEECAHALQHIRGRFCGDDARETICLREIEAKTCLEERADRYAIPENERQVTTAQLRRERERLAQYRRWDTP